MPSASSLFLLFSISENPLLKIFSELQENLRGIFIRQGVRDKRATWGATQGPGASPAPWRSARPPLDAYKFLVALKIKGR